MRNFYGITVVLLALLISGGVVTARADQNDQRLDTLFGRLQQTNNLGEVAVITRDIWGIWTEIDDQDAYQEMLQGIDAMAEHDFKAALVFFDGVIRKYPAFAEGWNKRATVYYLMGRLDESLNDVEATLDLEPRHFGALSGKGLILMARGDYILAIKAFEHALETNPHMPDVHIRIKVLKEEMEKNAI